MLSTQAENWSLGQMFLMSEKKKQVIQEKCIRIWLRHEMESVFHKKQHHFWAWEIVNRLQFQKSSKTVWYRK